MAINDLKELAKSQGGQCLSDSYLGAKVKLKWRCEIGHEWEAIPDSVKRGTWCPHCAGQIRLTLANIQELARSKGGECLSTEYINADTKMRWRRAEGHEWTSVSYHIKAGSWCPVCSAGKSERICRDIFEQMFGLPFPKLRPNWLLSSMARKMELDGYCEPLGIAFEYNGHQHYREVKFFQSEKNTLEKRKLDDARKAQLCFQNGVILITVPYTIPMHELPSLVHREAQKIGIRAAMMSPEQVKVAEFVLPEMIEEMQALAKSKGGECLSTFYVNSNTKLNWRCAKGHEWAAVPGSIKVGSWCAKCMGRLSPVEALKKLKDIAASKGGLCLAKAYTSGKEKLLWRCASGHKWLATAHNIRAGSWCYECSKKTRIKNRLGIELCQQAAESKGGKCLSEEYVNSGTKLNWRCAEGHEWAATPDSVLRIGTWCPKCSGKRAWETRRQRTQL